MNKLKELVYNWTRSSANPEDFSVTIQGLLLALVPLTIQLAQTWGVPLSESDLVEVINALALAFSTALIAFGGVRKIILAIRNR